MKWHAQLTLVLAQICLVAASSDIQCFGKSDDCSSNPIPLRRFNPLNYHPDTCNLKWKHGCTSLDKHGGLQQKPPPFSLCNSSRQPAGQLRIDAYTLSLQDNNFAPGAAEFTLHGLWPGSAGGDGPKNQPYGCQNGEEFDERILKTFGGLLNYFWPTNARFNNTMECFIMSEWMKHGTCAVIPGADGTAFRLPQETYFRTAFVMANEFNANAALREQLHQDQPLVTTRCVQCAYLATVGWTGADAANVPRMSGDCIDQCFACGENWDRCPPAQLDSTVQLDPSNAPLSESSDRGSRDTDGNGDESFPLLNFAAMPAPIMSMSSSDNTSSSPWEGTWRSFGAEQLGSGKFEFAQTFIDNVLTVTTDSPYPQTCTYERGGGGPGELVMRCGGAKPHLEGCLAQRLPDIGGLEAAFLACNHTGEPAPSSFYAAMDTPGCGNFLMFRCKASAAAAGACSFSPDAISASADSGVSEPESEAHYEPGPVSHSQPGIAGAPPDLLGLWRSLEVSSHYQEGLAQWNFTADGQASLQWPNHPSRGVQRYSVSHSDKKEDAGLVLLASASDTVTTCRFQFQHHPVYSYAVLDCGNTQWAMGRCNPCSAHCRYSCGPENDFCGAGSSCDPAESQGVAGSTLVEDGGHDWCTPQDSSCWPTETEIRKLEWALDPTVSRLGVQLNSFPQPQSAPVPTGSVHNESFYGLGNAPEGLRALYYYEDLAEMQRPCFIQAGGPSAWNDASDMCKAALRQNEYRNWNPFIVVFPLNERHVAAALRFAARHRLCISTAGTGHEYNSRNACPTGGILIRTILLKDKDFMPTWGEDPTLAPAGAFRFGAGSIFAEMHAFSAEHDRVVASGWCSTVGMVGWHLGGGHGPFAPSMGLGVDNLLEVEVLQLGRDAHGQPVVHKKTASRRHNPQLFWAMRGGGGGVWGVVLSMTVRAHAVPDGGLSRVFMSQTGTFCPESGSKFGYEWLRDMWTRFAAWQLRLNHKVSTQPGFFINTTQYKTGGLCAVTWTFSFEYFYAGGQAEKDYVLFRDGLQDVLQTKTEAVQERNFNSAYEYILSMPADKFALTPMNPLPAPHPPSDAATGSQNSVFISRHAMETKFASTMMDVLDICVQSLEHPDPTSPDSMNQRCGFHYLYTSLTGNLGSAQPGDTAISPGFRSALMLWNARTLTTQQSDDTVYRLGPNSYFSESSYVMHNWTSRYWSQKTYEQLLAVKKAHDPGNHFWCHHCVGDNPDDAYGEPLGAAAVADFIEKDGPVARLLYLIFRPSAYNTTAEISSWAPRWFGRQWITVDDLYRHDDLSGNETPEPQLGDKRWKRDTIIARGNELCSLDISTFDNADLATLYEHLVDVDETMLHIKDDWPVKRFVENDEVIVASHMSKQQIASDETQALVAKRLTERYDHIRAIINKRRLGRKLSLNDFPTEIINRIIDHCEDYANLADDPEYVDAEYEVDQQELNTIKSLRLTCHRLNELASLRLIPAITISPTEESLSRLETVSKHGVFGKAIKRVRLVIGYYSHMATTTAATFSYYASETMNRAFVSRELDWGVGVSRNPHESNFKPFFDNLSKADKEKLFRLRGRLSELSEDSDSLAEEELAWKAYNRYIQRHQEYQGLMDGDHFVRRVTEATALLPRAHRLDVYDYSHEPNDWRHKYVSTGRVTSDESIIELLTAPMEWNRLAADFNPGQNPSVVALGKLLPALGKAGVRLKAFEMNVTPPIDFKPLFLQTEEARLHTNELLRDVWFLRLCIKARPMFAVTDGDGISNFWPCRSADEDKALDGFIDTLLSSESLGWLQLNFEDLVLEKGAGRWFLPAVMKPRRASHPCRMDLLHVWLDSGMMDAFLGDGPLFLTLGAPIMKHGTWMEALTIMRQKFKHDDLNLEMRHQSSLSSCMRGMHGLVVGDIQFANGGECDGMNVFDYDDTFGDPKGSAKNNSINQDDNVEMFSEAEGSGDDSGMDEDDFVETISELEGSGFDSPAMDYIHHERDDNPLSRFNSE